MGQPPDAAPPPANGGKAADDAAAAGHPASVDQLFRAILPPASKAGDAERRRFLTEYLGRLDSDGPPSKPSWSAKHPAGSFAVPAAAFWWPTTASCAARSWPTMRRPSASWPTSAPIVAEVHNRVQGRYPDAQPLPGRPGLDTLMRGLDLGFEWNGAFTFPDGTRGAYCLPHAGLTAVTSLYDPSRVGPLLSGSSAGLDPAGAEAALVAQRHQEQFDATLRTALAEHRFLALTVRPSRARLAAEQLVARFALRRVSFDALLLRHLHQLCDGMTRPPDWQVVLGADAADPGSVDRARLLGLVRRVLPALTDEILGPDGAAAGPVLLTDTGLIGRYDLVDTWLAEIRRRLADGEVPHALLLLIASDGIGPGASLEGVSLPDGPGRREHAAIPSQWLRAVSADVAAGSA